MVDPDGATCSQCGAPISPGEPAGLCPRCFLSDTQVGQSKGPEVSPSSPEGTTPRPTLSIALAIGTVAAILLGILWFGTRRGEQRAVGVASQKTRNAAKAQMEQEQEIAEQLARLRRMPEEETSRHRANAFNNYGNELYQQGKLEEAIEQFRAAIKAKPDLARAHYDLGIALKAQGKLEEAIAELTTAIRLKPGDAHAHGDLGVAQDARGSSRRRSPNSGRPSGSHPTIPKPTTSSASP